MMADDIIQFQAGRYAAMAGCRRDRRRSADYLEGFDMEARHMRPNNGREGIEHGKG